MRPWLYDAVQIGTGAALAARRIRTILGPLSPQARVLDVGGGTGLLASLFGPGYCCLDLDRPRLQRAARRGSRVLAGDATQLPIASGQIDLVVLRAITHHLPEAACRRLLAEARRVLRPDGRLLFLDAVWAPRWIPGRLLWRVDGGRAPRTEPELGTLIERRFAIDRAVRYALLHRYYLAVARPRLIAPSSP